MTLRAKHFILLFLLLFIYASFSLANIFADAILWAVKALVHLIKLILEFFSGWVAGAIDYMREIQLFGDNQPADVIWKIFLNLAYPLLIFATLYVAFQYILGKSEVAHRMLWYIILVALFINFTFAFLKEAYGIVLQLENSLLKTSVQVYENNQPVEIGFGRALKELFFKGMPDFDQLSKEYQKRTEKDPSSESSSFLGEIAAQISIALFYMFAFVVLIVIAALMLGRIIYISAMTGLAPLALVSLALPLQTGYGFSQWLRTVFQWLSVVLVFTFLVIIGISIHINIIQKVFASSTGDIIKDFINYTIGFMFLVGWYLLSLNWAVKAGVSFGSWGKKIGYGALGLLGAGALALGKGLWKPTQRRAKYGIGRGLSSIGARLRTRGGAIGRLGLNFEKRGSDLQKDYIENVLKQDLEIAKQNVETGKDDTAVIKWIQKNASSKSLPVQRMVAEEIGKLSKEDFKKLLQITNAQEAEERLKYLENLRKQNRIVYNALINRLGDLQHKQLIQMINNIDQANLLDTLNANLPEMYNKLNSILPVLNARSAQGREAIDFLSESFRKVEPSVDPEAFTRAHGRDQNEQAKAFVNMATTDPKKAAGFITNNKWVLYLANLFDSARDEFDRLPPKVKQAFQSRLQEALQRQNISPPQL